MWRGRNHNEESLELEGYAVLMKAYTLADCHVTEIRSEPSEAAIAVGIASTEEESRAAAVIKARAKLIRTRCFDLMVGG
jgi:hypothetical protein